MNSKNIGIINFNPSLIDVDSGNHVEQLSDIMVTVNIKNKNIINDLFQQILFIELYWNPLILSWCHG